MQCFNGLDPDHGSGPTAVQVLHDFHQPILELLDFLLAYLNRLLQEDGVGDGHDCAIIDIDLVFGSEELG